MADLALIWGNGAADLAIVDDDLATDEGLETAVLVSLFTDRRAETDDVLPDDDNRRGWWADEFLDNEGDRVGSRLWLLDRSAQRTDVVPRVEEYARDALSWLLEDQVAQSVDVVAEVSGGRLGLAITVERPGRSPLTIRFAHVWDALAQGVT